jgi:Prenyltransferase and squalene oxidase repeat
MAEVEELQRKLLKAQNHDGGWGYETGSSWTEPTAFALLALEALPVKSTAYERGCVWLKHKQRKDGGWPPGPSVDISTWVTSLALLALSEENLGAGGYQRAIEWTLRQIRPELTRLERLLFRVRGLPRAEEISGGSPWFPGTAAWIAPTVMSVLALSGVARRNNDEQVSSRVRGGKQYILSRRCHDGGWNHGGTSYRSQNAESYPEMTGMALLALHGARPSDLSTSLQRAEDSLRYPGSMEGLCWLQLGLLQHGRDRLNISANLQCRTTRDVCLRLLVLGGASSANRLLIQG